MLSAVRLGRGSGALTLRLGALLGEGASGKVFDLPELPGKAAKLYHTPEEARRYDAKIDAMLARAPDLPAASHGGELYPQIAWPEAKLYDAVGAFIGFVMPEIDFARSTSLVNLLQKASRRVEGLSDYYGYRVLVARNLAAVFAELHRAGHHMIDMKPANLRFYPAVSWMAVVDADGFSISGASGRIGAAQLSDEYIAPESWDRKPAELGIAQDEFALAVILFQLLNNGVHPFAGTPRSGSAPTDLQTRIRHGLYPYAAVPPPELSPSTASIHRMFRRSTRALFDAAFLSRGRPSALAWRDHLDGLLGQLAPCAVRPGEHAHFGLGCGFCGHEARIAATRTAPRRPVAARPTARPAPASVLPLQHVVSRPAPVRRPPSRASNLRFGAFVVGIVAMLGASVAYADQLRELISGPRAYAAALPIPAPSFAGRIDPLEAPREYLILPPGESQTVVLREGPDERYAGLAAATVRDELLATGSAKGRGGAPWLLVSTRDGATGFVPATLLVMREELAPRVECPPQRICVDSEVGASEAAVVERYRTLLGRAQPGERRTLEGGHRQWQQKVQACVGEAQPALCRTAENLRRLAALDDFAVSGFTGQRP